ncbi:hypothetical protein PHLCEN_2v10719 [Hermanssonia centrifuga]|uniref:Uncharacterized protein n=1 Tax=Hermanssonia centrifuga TaxID=98765 RepID=A0A2R6NM05_9APHY|nr:hypothetical protein PHLCEN_2v10719 [Hermanssonia centrifuga]
MTAYTALKHLREFCSSAERQDGTPDTAKMVWRVQMKAGKMKGVPVLLQKNETAKLNGFPNRQLAGRKRVGLLVAEHLSKLRENC